MIPNGSLHHALASSIVSLLCLAAAVTAITITDEGGHRGAALARGNITALAADLPSKEEWPAKLKDLFGMREEHSKSITGGKKDNTWPWMTLAAAGEKMWTLHGQQLEVAWNEFIPPWVDAQRKSGELDGKAKAFVTVLKDIFWMGHRETDKGCASASAFGKDLEQKYAHAFKKEMGVTDAKNDTGSTEFLDSYIKSGKSGGVWATSEMEDEDCGDDKGSGNSSEGDTPFLVAVYGSSGAGKTRTTKGVLCRYFKENRWTIPETFLAVDGGRVRDLSQVWIELKCLRDFFSILHHMMPKPGKSDGDSAAYLGGFTDAFKLFSHNGLGHMKNQIFKTGLDRKMSMVLIDTGTSDVRFYHPVTCSIKRQPMYDRIQEAAAKEYYIGLIAVATAFENVERQMNSRQLTEGKKAKISGGLPTMLQGLFGGPWNTWHISYEVANNMLKQIHKDYCFDAENKQERPHRERIATYFLVMRNNWKDALGKRTIQTSECSDLNNGGEDTDRRFTGYLWVPRKAWPGLDVRPGQLRLSEGIVKNIQFFTCKKETADHNQCKCESAIED